MLISVVVRISMRCDAHLGICNGRYRSCMDSILPELQECDNLKSKAEGETFTHSKTDLFTFVATTSVVNEVQTPSR